MSFFDGKNSSDRRIRAFVNIMMWNRKLNGCSAFHNPEDRKTPPRKKEIGMHRDYYYTHILSIIKKIGFYL